VKKKIKALAILARRQRFEPGRLLIQASSTRYSLNGIGVFTLYMRSDTGGSFKLPLELSANFLLEINLEITAFPSAVARAEHRQDLMNGWGCDPLKMEK